METNATEIAVGKALSAIGTDPKKKDNLARSLARSISYDAALADMGEEEIRRALEGGPASTQHHVLLETLRLYRQKTRQRTEKTVPGPGRTVPENTVNKGFFLQCWHAFLRDGHLGTVRMLTVRFLAKWLTDTGRWIEEDEKDWCARNAVNENEERDPSERESRTRDAYDEAVVLLVMHKFSRSLEKQPEKTRELLDSWEKEYTEYCLKTFGNAPDWSPSGFTRTPATRAFMKKNGQ